MVDINGFSAKRKHVNFVWYILPYVLFMAMSAINLYYDYYNQSAIYKAVTVIIMIFCIFIISLRIYVYYFAKNEMKWDIVINSEQIIIPDGIYRKPKVKNIKDIRRMTVPKWDDLVEIVFNDKTKIKLSLDVFKEEDKKILRELLLKIKDDFEGNVNQTQAEEKLNEWYMVNGKSYIK